MWLCAKHVCVCVCVCVCVFVCMYNVHRRMFVVVYNMKFLKDPRVCVYVYMYVCRRICVVVYSKKILEDFCGMRLLQIDIYRVCVLCMYVRMYICMYACMHACTHVRV
jgi:hypothetical protein